MQGAEKSSVGSPLSLPGDELAVEEEFEGGAGTYLKEGTVRSAVIGKAKRDLKKRVVSMEAAGKKRLVIPQPGDIVIAQIESAQGSIATAMILYHNGVRSEKGFTAMLGMRSERQGHWRTRGPLLRPSDLVVANVISNTNAIIHLSIDGREFGVIHANCSLCGSVMVSVGGKTKCVECGNIEDRKISTEFGKFEPS